MKILLVEDRRENIEEAERYFAKRPYLTVEYAKDYKEAMRLLGMQPDGLVCDLFFPEETGTKRKSLGVILYLEIYNALRDANWISQWGTRDIGMLYEDVINSDETKQPLGILVLEAAAARRIPYVITSSMHAGHGSAATPVAFYLKEKGMIKDPYDVVESSDYGLNIDTDTRDAELTNPKYIKGMELWEKVANQLLHKIGGV